MGKLDRALLLMAIILQIAILAKMGAFIRPAYAFGGDSPPRFDWSRGSYYTSDTWQSIMNRLSDKLIDWAEESDDWNRNVQRRLNDTEQNLLTIERRLLALETAKSPAPKKAKSNR